MDNNGVKQTRKGTKAGAGMVAITREVDSRGNVVNYQSGTELASVSD